MFTLLAVLLVTGLLVDILIFKSWESAKFLFVLVTFFGVTIGLILLGIFLSKHHIP